MFMFDLSLQFDKIVTYQFDRWINDDQSNIEFELLFPLMNTKKKTHEENHIVAFTNLLYYDIFTCIQNTYLYEYAYHEITNDREKRREQTKKMLMDSPGCGSRWNGINRDKET